MNKLATNNWIEANQGYLTAALAVVHTTMECYIVARAEGSSADLSRKQEVEEQRSAAQRALREAASSMPKPSTVGCFAFRYALGSPL